MFATAVQKQQNGNRSDTASIQNKSKGIVIPDKSVIQRKANEPQQNDHDSFRFLVDNNLPNLYRVGLHYKLDQKKMLNINSHLDYNNMKKGDIVYLPKGTLVKEESKAQPDITDLDKIERFSPQLHIAKSDNTAYKGIENRIEHWDVYSSKKDQLPETYSFSLAETLVEKTLTYYKGTNFIGKKIICDVKFKDSLKKIDDFASKRGVKVYVTNSFRPYGTKLQGTIVKPASRSNHSAGHGIDMNVQYNGKLYNSTALKKDNLSNLPAPVRGFIQDIRDDKNLRWGGDFKKEDPVHIDDHLNNDKEAWDSRYNIIQKAYKDDHL